MFPLTFHSIRTRRSLRVSAPRQPVFPARRRTGCPLAVGSKVGGPYLPRRAFAFTLVELLLVMAILTIIMAIVAPTLSRSLRGHKIDEEATRFVALTEYARSEAISQGIPMIVWIDGKAQSFGLDPQSDYYQSKTHRQYNLNADVHFDSITGGTPNTPSIIFSASGTPDPASIDSLRLVDRFGAALLVNRRSDGWGYQIAPSTR